MKTTTKLALAGLTAALLASGSVLANDSGLVAVDNHHGSVIYLYRQTPKTTTVAFVNHGKGIGSTDTRMTRAEQPKAAAQRVEEPKQTTRNFTTGNGTVTYTAPAE